MKFANPLDDPDTYEGLSLQAVRDRADKAAISGAINRQHDFSAAGAELGVSRYTLYRRVEQLGIQRPPRKGQ